MYGVELRQGRPDDVPAALAVQKAAFTVEASLYQDPDLPPLRESEADIVADLASSRWFVALLDGRLVGSVRVRPVHIARLSVAPDAQRRGIGAALLTLAETAAPAEEALLFTGHLSAGNLRLYARAGYVEERRERVDDAVVLVHLRKDLAGTPRG
ncbi:MAG: GNAT family N-acetyltransferase [Actinobacteria bacterium HGW-Actinobacteria-5]|nr:MAG: GNAT family N-acetyltransferase [Actinobacteria bacterium HGW-Actinobacteria-5]